MARGHGTHVKKRDVMLELLTLTLCSQPWRWGRERKSPQREEGTPKKFQPLAGKRLMPSHGLLSTRQHGQMSRRDPLILCLFASGSKRSLSTHSLLYKTLLTQQLSSTQNSSWSWLSACRDSRAPDIPGRSREHLTAPGLTSWAPEGLA